MEISGVTSPSSSAQATRKAATVDYNAFLQLLVAQMKNQDPTKPTDGTQFLSQLASFSAVEQSVQMNSKLDALIAGSLVGEAGAVIGRTATSADGGNSGTIASVSISGQTLVARLADGSSIALTEGVSIS